MNNDCDHSEDLKHSGLKSTRHRTAILDVLEQSDQPISAEQVYLLLKEKAIPIHLSTVYRTLEILACKNLVTKLSLSGDDRAFYEFNRMGHRHYLVCMGCKKVLTINHCPLEEYEKALAEETDFTIEGHKLDIYGYCPACKKEHRPGPKHS